MGVFRAVFWSFFGVRKGQDLEQDARQLRPIQIIVAGLAAAALLVLGLILLAVFVTRQGS
jgi:hypothetical protein